MSCSASSTLFLGIQLDVNYSFSPKEFKRFDPKTGQPLVAQGEVCRIIVLYGDKMLAHFEQELLKQDHKVSSSDYQNEWRERLINQCVYNWLKSRNLKSICYKDDFGYQNLSDFSRYNQEGKILVGLVIALGYSNDEKNQFQEIPFISQDTIALQALRLKDIFGVDNTPVLTLQTNLC